MRFIVRYLWTARRVAGVYKGKMERGKQLSSSGSLMCCGEFWVVELEVRRRLFVGRCWKARRRNKYESVLVPRRAVK